MPQQVRRTRMAPADRRVLIEEAAAEHFFANGYSATRMEDIAEAAGVTKPMLYRHFKSKRDLYVEILERQTRDLVNRTKSIAVGARSDVNPGDQLTAVVEAWFELVEDDPQAWRMLYRDATGEPAIEKRRRRLQTKQRRADLELIAEALPAVPADQVEPLTEMVRSSLSGLALWWLDHPRTPRSAPLASMVRMVNGLVSSPS